ncbi:MAG: sugar phosphate isomerase/epimerase [Oscillospiraceae bacterium]|nr:sugar phosphate isomerase/epimerase [Oscillospiraceae bacterium]
MQLGIGVFNGVSVEIAVKVMKKYNITHTFVMSDIPDFHQVVQTYLDNGIRFESLHAPYKGINAFWGDDEAAAEHMLAQILDGVDKCAQYGIPAVVVHLSSGRPMPAITEKGRGYYERIFAYAKEKGVAVALENLRYAENLHFFMEHYPEASFCWDCGHEYCSTKGERYMKQYAHRLKMLHLHDNRCEQDTDDHMLPFDGNIPMERVAQDLAESGYQGALTLEVGRKIVTHNYDDLTEEEFMERAAAAVIRLNELVESYRK